MTTVSFHMEGSRLTGFTAAGHSLCECAINDVLGLEASVKVRKKDASITLKLPDKLGQTNEATCQALLTALMVYLSRLHEEYPDHISVLEV